MSEATDDGHAARSQIADPERGTVPNISKRRSEEVEDGMYHRWWPLFGLSLLAVTLDPLFFYVLMINDNDKCLKQDKRLGIIAIILRTFMDIVHSFFWLLCYEQWFRGQIKKCRCSYLRIVATDDKTEKATILRRVTEVASVLPFPQAATIMIIRWRGSPLFTHAVTLLKFSVLSQLIIRLCRVYPSYKRAAKYSRISGKGRVWAGAALNLLLFVISGHAVGAFWYLSSVGRNTDCWIAICRSLDQCDVSSLYCEDKQRDKSFLNDTCFISSSSHTPPFDFGVYRDALQYGIVSSNDFLVKLGYCLSWGLRNLASFAQSLQTSDYIWEILLSISISIAGLFLFSLFIGNMALYLQSSATKDLKEMQEKTDKPQSPETKDLEVARGKTDKSQSPGTKDLEVARSPETKDMEVARGKTDKPQSLATKDLEVARGKIDKSFKGGSRCIEMVSSPEIRDQHDQ